MRAGVLVMIMLWLRDGKVTGCSVRKTITELKHSKAYISCPFMENSSEVNYLLFLNDSNISKIHVEKEKVSDPTESQFPGQFEVKAYTSGKYKCKAEVIYPPPFREDCHITEVIVTEEQSLPTINHTVPVANQSCPVRSPFIPDVVMWVGCGVLLVYSLTITCITIVLWRKLHRPKEEEIVYANTRPVEFRKPSKI